MQAGIRNAGMETTTKSEQSYQELLDDVRGELQEGLEKKKDRVLELAKKLEDGVKPEPIANHVVHDLDDLVTKRWILMVLPDKYKQKEKQHKKEAGELIHQTTELSNKDGTVLLNKQGDELMKEERKMTPYRTTTSCISDTILKRSSRLLSACLSRSSCSCTASACVTNISLQEVLIYPQTIP